MSIREATKYCENAVVDHCVNISCPKYCSQQRDKQSCLARCTNQAECRLVLEGPTTPVQSRTRDQLFGCIAQTREDNQKKKGLDGSTGRRDGSWTDLYASERQKKQFGGGETSHRRRLRRMQKLFGRGSKNHRVGSAVDGARRGGANVKQQFQKVGNAIKTAASKAKAGLKGVVKKIGSKSKSSVAKV